MCWKVDWFLRHIYSFQHKGRVCGRCNNAPFHFRPICNKTGCFSFLSPFCKRRHKLRQYSVVIIMSLCVPCSAPRRFVNGKQNNREKSGTVRNARCYGNVVPISTVFIFACREYSSTIQTGKCFRFMFNINFNFTDLSLLIYLDLFCTTF